VLWTPTALILDWDGVERARSEGYLPNAEFCARLEMALARIAFMRKQWAEAEKQYAEIAEKFAHTSAAPQAVYWKGVSRYKATSDHKELNKVAEELKQKHPNSLWALKASIWSR
jgi:outer membrane protein assembly factor BamD (BamD/ComL family)